MREIKFRAWDKKASRMFFVENMSFRTNHDVFKVWEQSLMDGHDGTLINTAFAELMQFTGLKDKNGKEIYEGDIVIIEDTLKDRILDDGSGPTEPANHLAPVVFQDGSFGAYIKENGDCFDKGFWSFIGIQDNIGMTLFEIIGNIYENPELLGGKNAG